MSLLKDIISYFLIYRKYIGNRMFIVFLLTAMASVTEAFGIALLLPLIEMVDSGLTQESSGISRKLHTILVFFGVEDSMVGLLIFMGFVFGMKGVIKFLEQGYNAVLSAYLHRKIKAMMFNQYKTMEYGYYSKRNTGHFINVITSQINNLINSFQSYKKFLSEIIITTSYMLFAFLISWEFASMAVVAGIFILFLFTWLNNYVKDLSRKRSIEQSSLNKFLVQTIQSFKYISSTAQFDHLSKGVLESINKLSRYMRNKGLAGAFTSSVKEPISIILILGIVIIQITLLNAPLAPILVSLVLIHRGMNHIIAIQSAWQQTLNSVGGIEMVENEFYELNKWKESTGIRTLPPFHDKIEINDLSFAYEQTDGDVLNDLNLKINVNSTIALVGESGAGKSTMVDMLTLLLRPQKGELIIDGIPGIEIELNSWRRQIGYVSQDTVVFDDTIANNICMWKGDYNRDGEIRSKIESAAERAYAIEFIRDLPKGFNTVVGDRGVRLSGGQKQRLFIARELFKEPRFLILDEATSALDSESEKYIQKSIDSLKGSTTVVIIAHRLSTIRNADIIYVLDQGRIVESGSYEELMSGKKNFHNMVQLQTL